MERQQTCPRKGRDAVRAPREGSRLHRGEQSQQKPPLPAPGPWASSLHDCEREYLSAVQVLTARVDECNTPQVRKEAGWQLAVVTCSWTFGVCASQSQLYIRETQEVFKKRKQFSVLTSRESDLIPLGRAWVSACGYLSPPGDSDTQPGLRTSIHSPKFCRGCFNLPKCNPLQRLELWRLLFKLHQHTSESCWRNRKPSSCSNLQT